MKKGFTLAEILITLGIIGVVAALTAPALVQNSGNAKIGPSLAKFVNTFEVGTEKMMLDEGLGSFATSVALPINTLAKYIIMTPYNQSATLKGSHVIKTNDEGETLDFANDLAPMSDATDNEATNVWQLKDGTIIAFTNIGTSELENKGAYKMIIGAVLVDINGETAPNKIGRDVFAFLLDKSGILIPVGGNVHKYIGETYSNDSYSFQPNIECNLNPSDGKVPAGFACTGKIADNGWKVVD